MSYDYSEKLKDEVGILVGLLNSAQANIVKLAKIQLIQLGKNAVPSLRAVLDDMYRLRSEYTYSGLKFRPLIVRGVLEVLSFFADDTLIHNFSEWLPTDYNGLRRDIFGQYISKAAVEGLIKIGSEGSFTAATPTLDSIFFLEYPEESEFSYLYPEEIYEFASAKDDIITDIINFVENDVVSKFITSYPDLDSGLKELVASLIMKNKAINYSDKILEWMDNGSAEDDKRLSKVVMGLGININRELSKKLFLRLISYHYKDTDSFFKYLLKNLEVDDMVEIELSLYSKDPRKYYSPGEVLWSFELYEPGLLGGYPKPSAISELIISQLQARREDAKPYITKVLADRNKDRVKAASWLLNYVNETHKERDQRL